MTDGNNNSSQPRIAVDSEGILHAFWMDKSDALNGKVFHRALAARWNLGGSGMRLVPGRQSGIYVRI